MTICVLEIETSVLNDKSIDLGLPLNTDHHNHDFRKFYL